jgi:hypothetical protein
LWKLRMMVDEKKKTTHISGWTPAAVVVVTN